MAKAVSFASHGDQTTHNDRTISSPESTTAAKTPGSSRFSRRDFLRLGALAGGSAILAVKNAQSAPAESLSGPIPEQGSDAQPFRQVAFRVAHISDLHVRPYGPTPDFFARALNHVQEQAGVDFILNTGDTIYDSLFGQKTEVLAQWELYHQILRQEVSLPIFHTIGNHDVWGWGLSATEQETLSMDPDFGKGLALRQLGLLSPYYVFDQRGWRFIVLDSVDPTPVAYDLPYTARLGEEQVRWLTQQLAQTPSSTPICIVSHIPIFSAAMLLDGDNAANGHWTMPGAWMHMDAGRLRELFTQHPNIRVCMSGHGHQIEELRYTGIKYLMNGALCGNFWEGSYLGFPPGYALVTFYADGDTEHEFVDLSNVLGPKWDRKARSPKQLQRPRGKPYTSAHIQI